MADLGSRVNDACHRIEDLWHETDGHCYVSFSGGKDSTVLLALIKLCEEVYTIPVGGIPAVFSNTGIEFGVTTEFVQWVKSSGWYSNVVTVKPEHSFDYCLKHYGKPLKSKQRAEFMHRWISGNRSDSVYRNLIYGISISGKKTKRTKLADKDMHMIHPDFPIMPSPMCCTVLKKTPLRAYEKANSIRGFAYGLRKSEGGARELAVLKAETDHRKICTMTDASGIIHKAPIIDWTDDDIEQFIEKYNVPLSRAYTEFDFHRTGCMACPFAVGVDHDLKYLHDHEPNRYKASMHWLKDVYIAQDVRLPFDEAYEREREWRELYEPMRQEMLRKYRPNSRLIKDGSQLSIFDMEESDETDTSKESSH